MSHCRHPFQQSVFQFSGTDSHTHLCIPCWGCHGNRPGIDRLPGGPERRRWCSRHTWRCSGTNLQCRSRKHVRGSSSRRMNIWHLVTRVQCTTSELRAFRWNCEPCYYVVNIYTTFYKKTHQRICFGCRCQCCGTLHPLCIQLENHRGEKKKKAVLEMKHVTSSTLHATGLLFLCVISVQYFMLRIIERETRSTGFDHSLVGDHNYRFTLLAFV